LVVLAAFGGEAVGAVLGRRGCRRLGIMAVRSARCSGAGSACGAGMPPVERHRGW
jgi:hypothetical protein